MTSNKPSLYHVLSEIEESDESNGSTTTTLFDEKKISDGNLSWWNKSPDWWFFIALHGFLFLFNFAIFSVFLNPTCPIGPRDLEISPARDTINYETKYFKHMFNGAHTSKYFGTPSFEIQAAWKDLMKYQTIAIPKSTMSNLGRLDEGIKFPDGSGYMATLNVYHELHCVQQLYMFLRREVFFPNLTEQETKDEIGHLEHCLEGLRESAMCRSDLSLVTMRWGHKQQMPLANWTYPHVCRKWEDVEAWAGERTVRRLFEEGWLMHPKFGWAYANQSRIGVAHDH